MMKIRISVVLCLFVAGCNCNNIPDSKNYDEGYETLSLLQSCTCNLPEFEEVVDVDKMKSVLLVSRKWFETGTLNCNRSMDELILEDISNTLLCLERGNFRDWRLVADNSSYRLCKEFIIAGNENAHVVFCLKYDRKGHIKIFDQYVCIYW